MPRIPKVHRPLERDKGTCLECGKSVTLHGTTGMLCSHINKASSLVCDGSGKAPSKATYLDLKSDWKPERRSK